MYSHISEICMTTKISIFGYSSPKQISILNIEDQLFSTDQANVRKWKYMTLILMIVMIPKIITSC